MTLTKQPAKRRRLTNTVLESDDDQYDTQVTSYSTCEDNTDEEDYLPGTLHLAYRVVA